MDRGAMNPDDERDEYEELANEYAREDDADMAYDLRREREAFGD